MGFLSKLLGRKSRAQSEAVEEVATMRHEGQRPVSRGFEAVTAGYEFVATLSPRTPLWILEKHGETRPGPESELPLYGGDQDGIWVGVANSWEELGIPGVKEMEGEMMASAVGHIPSDGGGFLPFLKEFRRIAEGASTIEDKLKQVQKLVENNPTYQQYGQALRFGDRGRLLLHLGWEVCALPINAETLYDAGYRSLANLRAASDEELLAIAGLGPKRLEKVRLALYEQ